MGKSIEFNGKTYWKADIGKDSYQGKTTGSNIKGAALKLLETILTTLGISRKNGTEAKKAGNGIQIMGLKPIRKESRLKKNVSCAVKALMICQEGIAPCSVQTLVSQRAGGIPGLIMKPGLVRYVKRNFKQINIQRLSLVQGVVPILIGLSKSAKNSKIADFVSACNNDTNSHFLHRTETL